MKLVNQDYIDKINNCPSENYKGEIRLFRWMNTNSVDKSFDYYGFKPKYANICNAWGLSTYKTKNSALEALKNVSVGMQKRYNAIAECVIKDDDGIKYQSGKNLNHYTFFPLIKFDLPNKFKITEMLEDEK